MKKGIHPKWYPDAKVICNGEVVMTVGSTQPELRVDVWSGNHPFYTGEQRIIDTAGQVDRFMKRLNRYSDHQEASKSRRHKAKKKAEQRFLKQQIIALDVDDSVFQALSEANIVTVGDLIKKLENDKDGLLELKGLDANLVEQLEAKLADAKEAFFAE